MSKKIECKSCELFVNTKIFSVTITISGYFAEKLKNMGFFPSAKSVPNLLNIFFKDNSRGRKGNLSFIFNLMRKLSLMLLKFGIIIITENNYNIGTLGDIFRMRTSLISKICLGKPFSMNEALSV